MTPARALLGCLLTLCCLAGSATAGPPPTVDARAWLVEDSSTGEVLAAYADREQVPV